MYGWFTGVFDTADLQEAKMLLEELSSSCTNTAPGHTAPQWHGGQW
jgi:hypothetical protein